MIITILVRLFPPKWLAGTEIATYNVAKYLAKKGHEVHVITEFDEGLEINDFKDGFYIHRIPFKKLKVFGFLYFWAKILFKIKDINPNIVHLQSMSTGIPGILIKFLLRKPILIYVHGTDAYVTEYYKKILSKIAIKTSNAIVVLTLDMKNAIKKLYNREVYIIPNGIDIGKFTLQDNVNLCNEKKVLFVGTLRPIKGVKYLIKSINILQKLNYNISLDVIGDGEERAFLEKITNDFNLGDKVQFLGKIPNEDIPQYMLNSDIFALPSISEGFPLVILEAMAAGLPIIASDVKGLHEIVKDGKNGFLFEPTNHEDLARKLAFILNNKKLVEEISTNNRIKANHYRWEKITDMIQEVYNNISKR